MNSFREAWPILVGVAALSAALTGGLLYLARRAHLLPGIRSRDVHTERKPRIGGVAMWLTLAISLLVLASSSHHASWLQFGNPLKEGLDSAVIGLLAGMVVLLVTGLIDDIVGLSPLAQFVGQVLSGIMLVLAGIGVTFIRLPFAQQLRLDFLSLPFHALNGQPIWLISALFTIGWVVLLINVINFFDGLDGLAGSIALTASVVLILISLRLGLAATATLAALLAATTIGFLPWNWYPSRIFMGTVGSQLLGFTLATIAIISGGKVATAVLVLGIPLFDALVVIVRRLLAGVSPFKADQRHLHHRLLKIGLPVPWVVITVNATALLFGILAYSTQESTVKGLLTLLLVRTSSYHTSKVENQEATQSCK